MLVLLLFFYFQYLPKTYPGTCFRLSKFLNVWRTFSFGHFSRLENSQKNPGYLRPKFNTLYQVTPRE